MSDRARRRVAWALFALPLACLPVALGIVAATDSPWGQDVAVAPVLWLAFSGVGLLVVLAVPRNAVGWLLLAIGLVVGLNAVTSALVAWDASRVEAFPGAALNAVVNENLQFVALGVLIPRVLLLFPTGRPPSRWWRVVGWAQIGLLASILFNMLVPGTIAGDAKEYENPLGVGALGSDGWQVDLANVIVSSLFVSSAIGSVVSLVVRARRSVGIERLQLKWVAWGAGLALGVFVASGTASALGIDAIEPFLSLALCLFPITAGIAVMRYRLYEIDRVISRTLAYAGLTVVLGSVYVGLVLGGQALFSSFAGGSDLAIAGSTLVVAALFLPVRSRVQSVVDRRFSRRRYDAQRTLEAFGARLREDVELGSLQADLIAAVAETMQPASASVWRRAGPA